LLREKIKPKKKKKLEIIDVHDTTLEDKTKKLRTHFIVKAASIFVSVVSIIILLIVIIDITPPEKLLVDETPRIQENSEIPNFNQNEQPELSDISGNDYIFNNANLSNNIEYWMTVPYHTSCSNNVQCPNHLNRCRVNARDDSQIQFTNNWNSVEYRQLLSSRCNLEAMERASGYGNIVNVANTHNLYFTTILTNPYTDPGQLPFRSTLNVNGVFGETFNPDFYMTSNDCLLYGPDNDTGIRCINSKQYGNDSNNNILRDSDNVPRWGAQSRINLNGTIIEETGTNFTFFRNNNFSQIRVDLWRPDYPVGVYGDNIIFRQGVNTTLNTDPGGTNSNMRPRKTLMWFNTQGTPSGWDSGTLSENNDLFRFDTLNGHTGNYIWENNNPDSFCGINSTQLLGTPHGFDLNDEHTEFRTRAAWSSEINLPHQINTQWVFDGAIRTFTPTTIVSGGQNQRIGINPDLVLYRWHSFDVICPATLNTNEPQLPIMKWHYDYAGVDQRNNNIQEMLNIPFNPDDERVISINFVRGIGE